MLIIGSTYCNIIGGEIHVRGEEGEGGREAGGEKGSEGK